MLTLSELYRKDVDKETVFISDSAILESHKYPCYAQDDAIPLPLKFPGPRFYICWGSKLRIFSRCPPPPSLLQHWQRNVGAYASADAVDDEKILENESLNFITTVPVKGLSNIHQGIGMQKYWKLFTKSFVHEVNCPTPKLFETPTFPCVLKPDYGADGQGIFICNNKQEYENACSVFNSCYGNSKFILTEKITDLKVPEYGAHFYINRTGKVTFNEMVEMVENEAGKRIGNMWTLDHQDIKSNLDSFVSKVAEALHGYGYFGAAGIDVLCTRKMQFYLTDINPRITSPFPLVIIAQEMKKRSWRTGISTKYMEFVGTISILLQKAEQIDKKIGEVILISVVEIGDCTHCICLAYSTDRDSCEKLIFDTMNLRLL